MPKNLGISNILDGTDLVGFSKTERDKGSAKVGADKPMRVVTAKFDKDKPEAPPK